MKIRGKKIEGLNVKLIPIPRDNGEDIILKAQAIPDTEPFEKLCPRPRPPRKMMAGGAMVDDIENDQYKLQMMSYSEQRMNWMVLESLKATEDLIWETVDVSDANTWGNYKTELRDSGFSDFEVGRIINSVFEVNSLSEEKIEAARKRFLASQVAPKEESSIPKQEQSNTASISVVNGSVSGHPELVSLAKE